MAAKDRMNNRDAQSATGSRASETFVVDLTSICVRSGTVRLPLSMIGRFSEGEHTARADGEELTLTFRAPRTLEGLAPFFERNDLRSNDRVRFEFHSDRLELRAVRRERSRSASGSQPAAASASRPEASPATPRAVDEIASLSTPLGFASAPSQHAADGDGSAAEGPAAEKGAPEAASSQANSVRAVRRVRIEGGTPLRADTPAPRPIDRASAHDVWARRQQPTWRPLDTTMAGPVVPPEEAAEAFSDTTVRVIRRSQGTVTPLEAEPVPVHEVPAKERKAPVSYSTSWPLDAKPRGERPAEQKAADVPARAELDPYLDAPIDVDREVERDRDQAILESDLLSIPNGRANWREASEEAYQRYESGSATEREPSTRDRRTSFLGRLGLGRGSARNDAARGAARDTSAGVPDRRQPAPVPVPRGANGSGQMASALGADLGGASRTASSLVATAATATLAPAMEASPAQVSAQAAAPTAAPQKRVIVDESVYDVDFETAVADREAADQAGASSLEADIAALRAFFERPDVPAIVRCDYLAEQLSVSQERVSRAMARLAEDRDRFTPLRGDAYMVRRAR